MKMAKYRLFIDKFPPNHHIILFFVSEESLCDIEKKKEKIEETRSKSHDSHSQKRPKFGIKIAEISAVYEPISSKLSQDVPFVS